MKKVRVFCIYRGHVLSLYKTSPITLAHKHLEVSNKGQIQKAESMWQTEKRKKIMNRIMNGSNHRSYHDFTRYYINLPSQI